MAVDVGEERLCRIGFADDIAVDGDIEQYLAHIVGKPHLGQILPAQSGTQHGYLLPIGHGGAVAFEQRGDHSRVAAGVHDVQHAAVQIDVVDRDIEVARVAGLKAEDTAAVVVALYHATVVGIAVAVVEQRFVGGTYLVEQRAKDWLDRRPLHAQQPPGLTLVHAQPR